MEVLAYWAVEQGTQRDGLLSRIHRFGPTLRDAMEGKAPKPAPPPTPPRPAVTVHGGQSTPAMVGAAEQFAESDRPRDWAQTTGSSREAIAWFTEGD